MVGSETMIGLSCKWNGLAKLEFRDGLDNPLMFFYVGNEDLSKNKSQRGKPSDCSKEPVLRID